jgi:chromosome segregation ATPase
LNDELKETVDVLTNKLSNREARLETAEGNIIKLQQQLAEQTKLLVEKDRTYQELQTKSLEEEEELICWKENVNSLKEKLKLSEKNLLNAETVIVQLQSEVALYAERLVQAHTMSDTADGK